MAFRTFGMKLRQTRYGMNYSFCLYFQSFIATLDKTSFFVMTDKFDTILKFKERKLQLFSSIK
jgi:hypothetical protein